LTTYRAADTNELPAMIQVEDVIVHLPEVGANASTTDDAGRDRPRRAPITITPYHADHTADHLAIPSPTPPS